jgi:hypothetical protein
MAARLMGGGRNGWSARAWRRDRDVRVIGRRKAWALKAQMQKLDLGGGGRNPGFDLRVPRQIACASRRPPVKSIPCDPSANRFGTLSDHFVPFVCFVGHPV